MSRKPRNSLLCPSCRKLISADEKKCPYCGMTTPGSPWKNNPLTRHWGSGEHLVKWIIYTNIAMYVLSMILNPRLTAMGFNPLSVLSPSLDSLRALGATGTWLMNRHSGWWTLIAANYLHGSILHIFFNLFALYQISPLITRIYGPYRYFIIYTFSGVAGFWISYLAGVQITIGASAAICGLIGSALYFGKSRGGTFGQAVFRQVGGWALGILIFGFLFPRINNWAHIGGMAAGALAGFALSYREKRYDNPVYRWLATIFVVMTAAALIWGVLRGFMYWIGRP